MDLMQMHLQDIDPEDFPAGLGYPGVQELLYHIPINTDGAIGGNPPLGTFVTGPVYSRKSGREGLER